jgi:hypothetical protein
VLRKPEHILSKHYSLLSILASIFIIINPL